MNVIRWGQCEEDDGLIWQFVLLIVAFLISAIAAVQQWS